MSVMAVARFAIILITWASRERQPPKNSRRYVV
jgi:hypothetical protein